MDRWTDDRSRRFDERSGTDGRMGSTDEDGRYGRAERTVGPRDGRTDRQTDGWEVRTETDDTDERNEWLDRETVGPTDRRTDATNGRDPLKDERMNEGKDGRTNGWTDE